jgi:hypothetical protein
MYGPGDNFDLQSSHVLPALMQVDDWVDAILYLLQFYDAEPAVNVGWGKDPDNPRFGGSRNVGNWLQGCINF